MSSASVRKTPGNPLAVDPDREQRVRERAYHLWETDGKPNGRDVEYWERARELIGMEESAGSGLLPNPQTHPEAARETGVEEAAIQENWASFPTASPIRARCNRHHRPSEGGARPRRSRRVLARSARCPVHTNP